MREETGTRTGGQGGRDRLTPRWTRHVVTTRMDIGFG